MAFARSNRPLSEAYRELSVASPGTKMGAWLRNARIKGVSRDPVSGVLLVAFKGPFRIEEIVAKSMDITDGTVRYARLDLDSKDRPVALEIMPL